MSACRPSRVLDVVSVGLLRLNPTYGLISLLEVLGMSRNIELFNVFFGEEKINIFTESGKVLPDPNLIINIDNFLSFIYMEIESWKKHSSAVGMESYSLNNFEMAAKLLDEKNIRFYIKSVFNVSTYYVACYDALDKLKKQINLVNSKIEYPGRVRKFNKDDNLHNKIKYIRDKSFIHQDSEKINNEMNKRVVMSWTPTLSCSSDRVPNCEDYELFGGRWYVVINGNKTVSDIDITINGFLSFAESAANQLENYKETLIDYFVEIKKYKKSMG